MSVAGNTATDPTHTVTIRRQFAAAVRSSYDALLAELRRGIVDRDVLGLREALARGNADDPPPLPDSIAGSSSIEQALSRLREWLSDAHRTVVVDRFTGPEGREYVRRAYSTALRTVEREERVAIADPDHLTDRPAHRRTLADIDRDSRERWISLEATVVDEVIEAVSEAIDEGGDPTDVFEAAKDRIDKKGVTGGERLAVSEPIRSFNDALLTRYLELGFEEVGIEEETPGPHEPTPDARIGMAFGEDAAPDDHTLAVQTAEDPRVCFDCRVLSYGGPYEISESYNILPEHPGCRCRWVRHS